MQLQRTARMWTRLILCIWGAPQQRMYHTPIQNLDDLKDRARTCWGNLDQQIIDKSIDHWRKKLKAVIRLNGGHSEQLFWLSGSFAALLCYVAYDICSNNMRAFCHCVSSDTMVRWQKVNSANNELTFQDKMDVVLCENKWRLQCHIIQHCTLNSFQSTITQGTVFIGPPGIHSFFQWISL